MHFDTMKNGYNRFQVDDALEKSSETIKQLEMKLDACHIQAREDQKKLQQYKDKYQDISRDLDVKEQAAKDMTKIALHEANNIVSNANSNADLIVKEALMSARSILISISKLGIEASEIKANLNEQLVLLSDVIEDFDVPPIPEVDLSNKYKD